MPFVIIQRHYLMPAVAETATEDEMLTWLSSRVYVPRVARESAAAAQAWLSTLPRPSGWYDSETCARTALRARPYPPRSPVPCEPAAPAGGGAATSPGDAPPPDAPSPDAAAAVDAARPAESLSEAADCGA